MDSSGKKAVFLLLGFLLAWSAFGQATAAPPRGFRGIELGMGLGEVKEKLAGDALFAYRGDPDVSLLPTPQQTLIECTGSSYIKRAFFQFHNEKLYVIILVLDPQRMDYYTMFSTLKAKYGNSTRLNPTEAVWEFAEVRMSLERPVNVKYIDTGVFSSLKEQGQAKESLQDLSRQMFLEQF